MPPAESVFAFSGLPITRKDYTNDSSMELTTLVLGRDAGQVYTETLNKQAVIVAASKQVLKLKRSDPNMQ